MGGGGEHSADFDFTLLQVFNIHNSTMHVQLRCQGSEWTAVSLLLELSSTNSQALNKTRQGLSSSALYSQGGPKSIQNYYEFLFK